MRGIMAARTKPLNVIPPTDHNKLTSVVKFELPAPKTGCKYLDPESMDELVELLHNETKVI
jgi:electron transfer flavoprotein beta subunit